MGIKQLESRENGTQTPVLVRWVEDFQQGAPLPGVSHLPLPVPAWPLGPHSLGLGVQHTEPWLMSDKIHERQRAVQSILLFLQYLVDTVKFTVSVPGPAPGEAGRAGGSLG